MTGLYRIVEGTDEQRAEVRGRLPHLDRVSAPTAELVVTAWVSAWQSSGYQRLDDMPYTLLAPAYRLIDHVIEVGELGVELAEYRRRRWGEPWDPELLVPTLLLHDLDKPLLYVPDGDGYRLAGGRGEVPHGVLGAMLLRELGFDDRVVAVVSTHAADSPFHSGRDEGWILHYADFFSCDHALRSHGVDGVVPFYQRHLA